MPSPFFLISNLSPFLFTSFLFTTLLFTGCQKNTPPPSASWQLFSGRDNGTSLERPLLYRALVPCHWKRQDPPSSESLAETTRAISEFFIEENDRSIRLTIHTFPIHNNEQKISPEAQINRWKKQFEELALTTPSTRKEGPGGFSGLFFEGRGQLQGNEMTVIGWSMQLAPLYEKLLLQSGDQSALDQKKRADYTIKASGPSHLMDKHKKEILLFGQSFELIEELPAPL